AIQTHFDFSTLPSAQNLFGIIANKVGNVVNGVLPDGGLLVMPTNPNLLPDGTYSNTSGTINTSQGGGGVTIGNTNQAFDGQGEGAWFMYVDNPATAAVGTLGLTPFTAANQGRLAPEVSITEVKIHNSAGTVIEDGVVNSTGGTTYLMGTGDANSVKITFQLDSSGIYSVGVSNLAPNETIEFFTAT